MEVKFKGSDNKEVTLVFQDEEVQVLVEYAIVSLVRQGIISLSPQQEDILANLDVKHMGTA